MRESLSYHHWISVLYIKVMESLDAALNVSPIGFRTREAIATHFWQPADLPMFQQKILNWEPYFRYYDRQCRAALVDRGRFVMAKTHHDILKIIRSFERGSSRGVIRESLRVNLTAPGRFNENEILDGAIDLAARLYLMVNIAADTRTISEQTRVEWTTGELKDCVRAHFQEPRILSDVGFRLEPIFTAANLECVTGIRVVPTDNLADHLRLMDRDGTVAVFCNVSFLWRHVRYVEVFQAD